MESTKGLPVRRLLSYLAASTFFLVVSLTFGYTKLYGQGIFWDGRVYATAIAALRAGGDPYAGSTSALLFVNPPLFIIAAGALSHFFIGHTGWYLYIATVIVAMVSIPYVLTLAYIRSAWMTPVVAMMLFSLQPRFMLERTMNTGNVAIPLYALVLLTGVRGIQKNQWFWFYLVVVVSCLIKPPFLLLLVIPLLAGRRQYLRATIATIMALTLYGVQQLTLRELCKGFGQAVYRQLVIKHDFGSGTYDLIYSAGGRFPILHNMVVASALHISLVGTFFCGLFLLRGSRDQPAIAPLWVPTLVVTAIVSNPRLQDYDSCVAILPALYIYMETFRSASRGVSSMAVAALGFNLLLVLFTTSYEVGLNVLCFGSILITMVQILSVRQRALSSKPSERTGVQPVPQTLMP